tara:strand:- start:176 stop:1303 length:1128 start_codon:yes stop_codon:yes gene_type:complete
MNVKSSPFLVSLFALGIWVLSTSSGLTNIFEVKGVPVDITAEDAALARSRALHSGQEKAFQRLLRSLTLLRDVDRLPKQGSLDVTTFVSDFSVSKEKTSSVRYLAQLNVQFKAKPVRDLLLRLRIPFAETISKPILIIPILQSAHGSQLWEETNMWRKVLGNKSGRSGLVEISLPHGNEKDISTLNVQDALGANVESLSDLADRYNAGDTIVSFARFGNSFNFGKRRLEISNVRYSTFQEPVPNLITLMIKPSESEWDAMVRGANAVVKHIEEDWKLRNLLENDGEGVESFTIPVSALKDWLDVKRQLNRVSVVRRVEIVLFSLDEVRVNLHYVGDSEQLGTALRQADLTIDEEDDGLVLYYVKRAVPKKSSGSQ